MEKVLGTKEIALMVVQEIFAEHDTIQNHDNGSVTRYGRLANQRPGAVQVREHDEMLTVRANIPGNGELGFSFRLFADEATEARINRFIQHYVKRHRNAVANWEATQY